MKIHTLSSHVREDFPVETLNDLLGDILPSLSVTFQPVPSRAAASAHHPIVAVLERDGGSAEPT